MQKFVKSSHALIDTSDEKFIDNTGLKKWAERENLKTAAALYAELNRLGFQSIDELETRVDDIHSQIKQSKKLVISLDKEIKSFSEIVRFAHQYEENKKYAFHYEKSKDPERYYREHSDQLALAWGAKDILEKTGIDINNMNLSEIDQHLTNLTMTRKTTVFSYHTLEREEKKLNRIKKELGIYLDQDFDLQIESSKRKTR